MYQIQGKFKYDRWQVLDEAETYEEAWKLYGEYRFELGLEWLLVIVKKIESEEGAA